MAKSKKSSKKDAKPAAIKDKSKAEFDKGLYASHLKHLEDCMGIAQTYSNYANQKLTANEQENYPYQLAKFMHESIDHKLFSDKEIKTIVDNEGEEGLAKKAYNTLEKYLYGADMAVQKDMLPDFKENVAQADDTESAYKALNLISKELKVTIDEKKIKDKELKNFVIVSNAKDTKSKEYKEALDKLVEAYIKDTVDNSNISDKAKKSRKGLLTSYYKEMGSMAAETAIAYYAKENEDKIKTLNAEYADKILTYKDGKQKIEAIMSYENFYSQLVQQKRGR